MSSCQQTASMSAEQEQEVQLDARVDAREQRASEREAPVLPVSQTSPSQPRPSDDEYGVKIQHD